MADKQGYGPDLKNYFEKRLDIKLNAGRRVIGLLRGHDQFMNIVLEDCEEVNEKEERQQIGTVMIRGNSIIMWECLDKVTNK